MEIIGLTGIGVATGAQVLSFDGGAMPSAVLLGILVISAIGILSSRFVSTWPRSDAARPALRLHPSPAGGR